MDSTSKKVLIFLALLFASAIVVPWLVDQQQYNMVGTWDETKWEYEKTDDLKAFVEFSREDIIRHEGETWKFTDDQVLYFYQDDNLIDSATWTLKGRGHILKIIHADQRTELYDIKEMRREIMVLNFDIGMETRGIARLTFKKRMDSQWSAPAIQEE